MTAFDVDGPIMVYLAEPIDQVRPGTPGDKERFLTGAGLRESLHHARFGIFSPQAAFFAPQLDPRIESINRTALYQADAIVAYLPAGIPSIGVPLEIEAATARGIPAVVLHDGHSQALAGNPLVTIIDHPSSAAEAVRVAIREHPKPDMSLRLVVREGMVAPRRAYDDDAGVDLNTAIGVVIEPRGFADIHTQVAAVELPPGYWGLVTGRSSTLRQRGLLVPNGVIDPGWRGPLYVGAYNLTDEPVTVKVGDRIGQLILVPLRPAPIVTVDAVSEHDRGVNGFGSSGS